MCEHNRNHGQTSATAAEAPRRSLQQNLNTVDYGRFGRLKLPEVPEGVTATGTLSRTLKRLALLRADAEEKMTSIADAAVRLHVDHMGHHLSQLFDQSAAEPNCAEHHEEMRALKVKHTDAERDFRRLDSIFRGTLAYEFNLSGTGEVQFFKGGKFVFTPVSSDLLKISGLEGVPPQIAEIVKGIAAELGATRVTVQKLDSNPNPNPNASHAEILELIRQLQAAGSRDGDNSSDNGQSRPRRSFFGEEAAANVANSQGQ